MKNSLRVVIALLSAFVVGLPNAVTAQYREGSTGLRLLNGVAAAIKTNPGAAERMQLGKALLDYCTENVAADASKLTPRRRLGFWRDARRGQ
jgi:hypothetical protein